MSHSTSKPTSLTFQILDTFTRDEAVIAEDGETREVAYDSGAESDDSLGGRVQKKQYDVTHRKEMIVHLFGKTAAGNTVRVDVKGFKPFFYIRIPSRESRGAAFEAIRRYLKEVKMRPETYELAYEEKQLFFGYHREKKYPFARITVASTSMFRALRGCFLDYETSRPALKFGKKLGVPFKEAPEVFEANLDPMLRFFHLRGIDPCGWVTISGVEMPAEDEGMQVECDWQDVGPAAGAVAPFVVASWDIECFSESGDFPLAKKGYMRVAKDLRLHGANLGGEELVGLVQDAFEGKGPLTRIQPRGARPTREQVGKWLGTEANLRALAEGCDAAKPKDDAVKGLAQFLDATLGRVGRVPLAGDPVIQIGTVLAVAGQPEKTERHCFVWPSCDPVEGVVIHEARTEAEMIKAWGAWMTERDPDILIGYNVFGFDEKYLWDRADELGVQYSEEIQGLNRLVEDGGEMKLEEKFLSSSAIGDKNLYMWATQGRLRVDVMFYICRSTPLPSYKLDEVTKTYMSGGLLGVVREGEELVLQVKGAWADARPGRYVCLLDETGESLTEKMPILGHKKGELRVRWVGRPEDDIEDEAWKDATQWVIVKDDVSPAELFKLHTGTAADRARVAAYCVQDCDLVLDLYYKLEIFNTSMSMANVCTVPVSYIFTRGQGIKIESLMFKEAYRRGQAVHVLPAPANRGAAGGGEDKYEGAIVLEPTVGLLGAPVGVADFASLYPSTIVSENISHDTLVWVKDYDHQGRYMKTAWTCGDSEDYDLPTEIPFTDIEFDLLQADPTDTRKDPRKISVGKRICRYAQDAKGTVPLIIEGLLAARKATRALIPKETDPLKISLLDAQQNAYKITANSLYGQLGSKTFKLRLQHLAASVTGYGRKQIMFAKAVIERFYGPGSGNSFCKSSVVYGDTDSLFVQFNPLNPETGEALTGRESRIATIELTGEAGHLVTQVLKAPHDFEFDKVYDPLLMFSKKLYAGRMFENEKKPDDFVYKYMGISIKRRGNAPIVKTVYGAAMNTVLEKRDVVGAAEIVRRGVADLVEGRTKMGQLIITKSLKAEYACTPPAHKVLADRIKARDPGNAPAAGDRLPYVYVRPPIGQIAAKLQGERIETPQYVREKGLVVDYEYYIQHRLKNPISQMFGILLEQMPGYSPMLLPEGWRNLDEDKRVAMRENVAAKLLFGDALARIAEDSKRAFVAAMGGPKAMGGGPKAGGGGAGRSTQMTLRGEPAKETTGEIRYGVMGTVKGMKGGPAAPPKVQTKISDWFADEALLKLRRKKATAKEKLELAMEAERLAEIDA